MRKKDDMLPNTLLDVARGIADAQGIDALDIRTIARKAGVATGTVYNYFSSKDEILLALTEEYWKQTLLDMSTVISADSFCAQLKEIFVFLRERINQSAGMLMGSLGNVETVGQARMVAMQETLAQSLIWRMEQDMNIRKDIWNETFTKEKLAHFIMMNMMMLLKMRASDPDFFLAIIRHTIY